MKKRLSDIFCVFQIHLARLRREFGPFLLAAIVFPIGMYFFASGIAGGSQTEVITDETRRHFLAASICFSLNLTAISWLGYLLLENRFTGRLKLFATLPLAASSYIFGIVVFALLQSAIGTIALIAAARILNVPTNINAAGIAPFALTIFAAVLALCGVSVIIAARVRSFSEGSLLTDALGAGMVLLAPVYYPAETLPAILRWIGYVLPTTYIASAVNKILAGNIFVTGELLTLAAMATVLLTGGFRLMNWREE